jgi:hypothetical protein
VQQQNVLAVAVDFDDYADMINLAVLQGDVTPKIGLPISKFDGATQNCETRALRIPWFSIYISH